MRTSWHDIWGCGRGPVAGLSPQVRILSGAVLFAAVMVAPSTSAPGILTIGAAVVSWVAACRPSRRITLSFLLLGLAVFLPYFLLVPLIMADSSGPATGWTHALAAPWSVFLRGMAGMLISTATVTTLSASDLRRGLLDLPVPNIVSAILLQIVHQAGELTSETKRVGAAIAVRGGTGGWLAAMRLLSSLPRVWLPRVIVRAERVALAMEFRGYCDSDLRAFGRSAMTSADGVALALALGVLALAAVLRMRGAG